MLSIPDMALLGAAALMFFGPEQLPKVARKAGLFMRDVQNTSQSFIREMERAADEHDSGPDVSRAHLLDEAVTPNGMSTGYPAYDATAHYGEGPGMAGDTIATVPDEAAGQRPLYRDPRLPSIEHEASP